MTRFNKILVANRGEIAVRVMRTAKAMGYRTVAVFSDADSMAPHVAMADQAVEIGASLPAQSYLRIEAIIEAARRSGADAVHPGYGFLAENAEFSEACKDAGLVFIGPSPAAIRAMGNKAAAKRLMQAAAVPCIPGYQGEDQSDTTLTAAAAKVGFPVMIKATAGGGGRGMRLVTSPAQFADALRSARSEAQSAFGNPEVILERAIINPRHIEVQVFADRYGNVIHLGERDCSIQRRHQKVIEEAPSPVVDAGLRARMGQAAVAAARAIRYEGAGTLEFLLDDTGAFYFMEMNTRLQVEHPVTESITGLDLVELQLRVASGEALELKQEDVHLTGHSMEARLCAEDVGQGFVPQSGAMELWRAPTNARVEHAMVSGSDISPYYDSMIAKLVSHGRTREEARRKLISAVEDLVALGVKTNQSFLVSCLSHEVFVAGNATTSFIATHGDALLEPNAMRDARAHVIAATLLYATSSVENGRQPASTIAPRLPIAFRFESDRRSCQAMLVKTGENQFRVEMGDSCSELRIVELEQNNVCFELDNLVERAVFARDGGRLLLQYRGAAFCVTDQTHAATVQQGDAADGKIKASMNGRVVAVHVAAGDAVKVGEPVVTVEAMKMEHVHAAPVAGVIKAVNVSLHEQVSAYRVLAEVAVTDNEAASQTP
ncbi:MAG: acetyl-CoA carboxylase biotin carboxylase subunit [Cupriavidus sp.]|nr:acetyl-CoA carboxylase biotin carboxylase subunit [Cupriavidus sp.]